VAEHPYRPELVRVEGERVLLAETERPPARVQVRAWSDGTTELRLHSALYLVSRVGLATLATLVTLVGAFAAAASASAETVFLLLIFVVVPTLMMMHSFRGETISVSPAAVSRRRRFGRADVRPLVDLDVVVVSGKRERTQLLLQAGDGPVALAEWLGYDDATLRWIAQRLKRAIEAAR
jgi:hypothetical protein